MHVVSNEIQLPALKEITFYAGMGEGWTSAQTANPLSEPSFRPRLGTEWAPGWD